MVEKLEMQKILPPISSSGVKKVKQKNGNMQQKNFGRHMKEEEKEHEENRESMHTPEESEIADYRKKGEELSETLENGEKKSLMNKEMGEVPQGRLIDILA